MKFKLKYNFGLKKILMFLLMILLFYGYESTFSNGNRIDDGGMYKSIIDLLMICYFLIILTISIIQKKYSNKSLIIMILSSIFILFSMIYNNDYSAGMILKIVTIISGFLTIQVFGITLFCNYFVKVMKVLAIYSLITYVIGIFFFSIITVFPVIVLENSIGIVGKVANIGLSVVTYSDQLRLRNYGLFREPGVYQAYLNIALLFELFILKNKVSKKNINIVIFSITLFSTLSTSGIVVWMLIMLSYFVHLRNNHVLKFSKFTIRIFILVFLLSSLVLLVPDIRELVFLKLTNGSSSWFSRSNSISSNINTFIKNPLFGVGMTQLDDSLQGYLFNLGETMYMHNTNTLLTQFSSYGLFFGILYCYCIWQFASLLGSDKKQIFLIFIAYIILLFSENYDTTFLFSIVLFMGLNEKKHRMKLHLN